MFDADMRLVFCNQRYIEMYGLSPDMGSSGCTLRDFVNHRVATGAFAGDPDEYIDEASGRHRQGQALQRNHQGEATGASSRS